MPTPERNPLLCAGRVLRCGFLVLTVLTLVTTAAAAAEDPNAILSQYRVFRLDTEERAIYVRRLDQATEQLWLDRRQVSQLDMGSPTMIGFDQSNRLLWLARGWEYEVTVIDLANGRHKTLPYGFLASTLAASSTGDRFVASRYGDYYDLTPRLFDWTSDWTFEGADTSWFSDIVNSRFVPWEHVSAHPAGDGLVIVTGNGLLAGPHSFPVVIADTRSGAIVAEFESDGLIDTCSVIALRDGEIFCRHGGNVVRLGAGNGELRGTYPRPGRWGGENWILPTRDAFIAISSSGAGIELQSFDPDDGTVLQSARIEGRLDDVELPPPGDVAFLHTTDRSGNPVAILPVLLASMEPDTPIPQDPNGYDVAAIGRVAPEWTPPALPTLTPTTTSTATPTQIPTPTPCRFADVSITLHPETVRPGESVELRLDVASAPGCLNAFSANFAPRAGVRLQTGGAITSPCSISGSDEPYLFSSFATECDSVGRRCTAGTSMVRAGYSNTTQRVYAMPGSFSIRCRATVPLDAATVAGSIGVTLVEFDRRGRQPAVERSVPLRVAGEAFSPTPTATTTPTRTATPPPTRPPAPTPCADCPALLLQPIHATRGGVAVVEVRLRSAGQAIVALQTDLALPAGVAAGGASGWRCRGNPFLRQRASFGPFDCAGDACRSVRALLYNLESGLPPLADGTTLFTCRITVAPTAAPGPSRLVVSKALGSDALGRQIPLSAEAALVIIR